MNAEGAAKGGSEGDFVVTDPAPRDALYSVAGDAIQLAEVRPRTTEPDSTTAAHGFHYDEEPDGIDASGRAWDAESGFTYRDEQEESMSVLGRVLTVVSSVASSGVAARYAAVSGTIGVEGAAPDDSLEEKWRALEALVPGLTSGALLLGHVEHAGLGTAAKTSEPLVDSETPLDAPGLLKVQVPDLRGDEADALESTAKLVFLRDAGAQVFIIIIIIIIIILMMMMMMMLVIINNNNKKIQ
jgi:hypothetical protein